MDEYHNFGLFECIISSFLELDRHNMWVWEGAVADDNDSSYQKFSSGSNVNHLNVNLIAACVEKQEEMREN